MIFTFIFIIQPRNRETIVSFFTSRDIPSQLGLTDSAEEKKYELENQHSQKNQELSEKNFSGQQVLTVSEKANFTNQELSLENGSWEKYSELDFLNRVGEANAMLDQDLFPTQEREDLSSVTPTGWKNKKIEFNGQQDYLYNRSHLIGFQLSGENANVKNLFTGTRALNANFQDEKNSMVYYENLIATYIKETNHHVRYRVTPIFKNVELVCRGVRMEAQSIEDDSISFDIYLFNIQPGYEINYLTGESKSA